MEIIKKELKEIVPDKFFAYALSVIKSRAVPDIRDGLKPVHRRILYAMYNDLHLYFTKKHIKSAKIVGDVIGKYHPHGDTAVYESMVRLSQDFVQKHPLIDGQGNFGSIDGDPPAAYRYTEARLTEFANIIVEDLNKNSVNYTTTYDESSTEPIVLPCKIPNVLINGSIGIAVGMATDIPTHNLSEILKAFNYFINNRNCEVRELLQFIKGPDFPTKGKLLTDNANLRKIYETGKGSVKLRSEYSIIEEDGKFKIRISSIPYLIEKKSLIEEIGKIILKKEIPGLIEILDLSDRDICIEIEFDQTQISSETIIYYLIKNTSFQTNIYFDFTCLNENNDPNRFNLLEIFELFLQFRITSVNRSLEFELCDKNKYLHILLGYEKIFNDLDNAIILIRNSKSRSNLLQNLIDIYLLDDLQAEKIIERKLHTLTKDAILEIREEIRSYKLNINRINHMLLTEQLIINKIIDENLSYIEKFGIERQTSFGDIEHIDFKDLIPDETNYFLFSAFGYCKRQDENKTEIKENKKYIATKIVDDYLLLAFNHNIKYEILFFSSLGCIRKIRANKIPHMSSKGRGSGELGFKTSGISKGIPWQTLVKTKDGERFLFALSLDSQQTKEFKTEKPILPSEYEEPYPHIIGITKNGKIIKYSIWKYLNEKKSWIKPRKNDEYIFITQCYAKNIVSIKTNRKTITFKCSDIPLDTWVKKINGKGTKIETIQIS